MKAEITFDLVMEEDNSFVEGCYRLGGGVWQVFIFWKSKEVQDAADVKKGIVWKSGVTGLNVILPCDAKLNKTTVVQTLSVVLGVTEWLEVRGPDSMQLR